MPTTSATGGGSHIRCSIRRTDVIGCVYLYPLPDSGHDARALSWVRASHAQLDTPLWRAVSDWLASVWPFGSVEYARRA